MPDLPNGVELGQSGLKVSRGVINEEFLTQLQGDKAYKVFEEMAANDHTVGAMLFVVEMLVRQAKWEVIPYSDPDAQPTPADKKNAIFIDQSLADMEHDWDEFLSECMTFLTYGWSGFEVVLKIRRGPEEDNKQFRSRYDDGMVGWRKFAPRAQTTLERWEFDDTGEVIGLWQKTEDQPTAIFIPIESLLLFKTVSRKSNPEGKSILRNAYRAWYMKKRIEEIEGIGIERDLAGIPKGFAPLTVLDVDAEPEAVRIRDAFLQTLRNLRRDEQEALLVPSDRDESGNLMYDVELMTTGGRRQFDTDKIISRWDHRIAMSILADFVLLGHQNVGSFALSQSKLHLFAVAIDAFLENISTTFNKHAIPALMLANGMDASRSPSLRAGTVEEPDVEFLGNYVKALQQVGVVLTDFETQNYLRSAGNLPSISAEELAAETAASQPEPTSGLDPEGDGGERATGDSMQE